MQLTGKDIKVVPVIIAIFFGSFISVLNVSTINIVIPVLQKEFTAELGVVQWTLTGFMLAMGTFAPVTGYFGERFSYKRLFMTALAGMMLASVFCALSTNAAMLIAFRILQGAFCGVIIPTAMSIIYQIVPKEKQPIAMSLWAAATMFAPAIGPTFAGWMLQHFSWQWLFWFNLPFGLLALAMVAIFIPYYRMNVPKKLDLPGLITVVVSSSSLLVSLSQGNAWGWGSWKTLLLLGAGLLFLFLFIWRELTTDAPLLDLRVLKNARFTLTSVILCITAISLYSGTLLTPIFLQNVQQVSPLDAGLVLLPASLVMAFITMFIGKLYAGIGPRTLLIAGTLLLAIGSFPLSWLSVDISHGYILLWMCVRNVGVALLIMPASNAGMEEIPPELSGHASSISNWLRNVCSSFAIALFTSLLASQSGKHATALAAGGKTDKLQIPGLAYTMSIDDVYLIATLIGLVALPFSFFIRHNKRKAISRQRVALES